MTKFIVEFDDSKKNDLLFFLEFMRRNHFKVTEMEEKKKSFFLDLKEAFEEFEAAERGEVEYISAEDLLKQLDEEDEVEDE